MKRQGFSFARIVLTLMVVVIFTAVTAAAQADADKTKMAPKKETVTKSQKGPDGDDPNIKDKTFNNDIKKVVPPPAKPGATRGEGPWPCRVYVNNRTGWIVQVYVDGSFRGLVGPWGAVYVNTGNGGSLFYGRADFTNAPPLTWGTWSFNCPANGTFTWTITP